MHSIQTDDLTGDDIYARLAAPFETVFIDRTKGVDIPYISGEQVATRLNEVLGVSRWTFRVLEHGYNEEADEIWVLGELVAKIKGEQVVKQQFGGQKLKRARGTGKILDFADTKKGAGTDAMKKCSMLIGIGLWLSHKEQNPDGTARGWGPDSLDSDHPRSRPRAYRQRAPASPPRERDETEHAATAAGTNGHKPERDPNELIRSLEHTLVQRIVTLKNEARERALPVPETKLPATRAQLIDWGTMLRTAIDTDKRAKGELPPLEEPAAQLPAEPVEPAPPTPPTEPAEPVA